MIGKALHDRSFRLAAVVAFLVIAIHMANGAEPSAGQTLHDRIVREYLESQWDEAAADLATVPKAPPTNTTKPSPQADLEYIRKTIAECRPPWWKVIKAGKKVNFRPTVWGRTQAATYDPGAKVSIQLNYFNGVPSVTVKWEASEMDNPAEAEHGFTKGDLNDLSIWQVLGTTDSWTTLSLQSQTNLDEKAQLLLSRYLQFRGNVTGAYYGTPRARRWDLWLDLASYEEKYAKMPAVMSRKTVGALFMIEVVGHPARYPSIKLPNSLPDENAEATLAGAIRQWIGPHGLSLPEDQSLRAVIGTFAAANAITVRQTGTVKLPNGLAVSLDPEADRSDATQREAWLREKLKAPN